MKDTENIDTFFAQFHQWKIKMGLKSMQQVLHTMGNPHDQKNIAHIAGTNGKGSTVVYLETLLLASGFSVCSTISPHLETICERFRYQGQPICAEQLYIYACKVLNFLGLDCNRLKSPNHPISFFELTIAIFFYWSKQIQPDFVLVETGLGGRLDATNLVQPLAAAVTPVGYDHQEYLGNSLAEILSEKLAILKPSANNFIGVQSAAVESILQKKLPSMGIVAKMANRDFYWQSSLNKHDFYYPALQADFSSSVAKPFVSLRSQGLSGNHQWDNLLLALAMYFSIVPQNRWLSEEKLQQALFETRWKGRMEHYLFLRRDGSWAKLLVDSAHNEMGVKNLLHYLDQYFADQKILFAFTWLKNKNLETVFSQCKKPQHSYRVIDANIDQAEKPEDLVQKMQLDQESIFEAEHFVDRIFVGEEHADCFVITGSSYWVGKFFSIVKKRGVVMRSVCCDENSLPDRTNFL